MQSNDFSLKVPSWIKMVAPKGSLEIHEEAWNAYPYCKTVISNPDYMKEKMEVVLCSWHKSDLGNLENVHNLSASDLKNREVIKIDIVKDSVSKKDYKAENDPKLYKNPKDANRSALTVNWLADLQKKVNSTATDEAPAPKHMTAYKLITIKFQWFGIQGRIEKFSHSQQRRILTLFHRQVYRWLDKWVDMTMEDIRALEDKTKKELEENIDQGEKKGLTAGGDN